MRKAVFALTAALLAGAPVLSEDLNDPEELLTARHGYMLMLANQLAPLGAMAKGEAPYDAAAAEKAAQSLAALASVDTSMVWAPGTEAGALADSAALPEIIANASDREARFAELMEEFYLPIASLPEQIHWLPLMHFRAPFSE